MNIIGMFAVQVGDSKLPQSVPIRTGAIATGSKGTEDIREAMAGKLKLTHWPVATAPGSDKLKARLRR